MHAERGHLSVVTLGLIARALMAAAASAGSRGPISSNTSKCSTIAIDATAILTVSARRRYQRKLAIGRLVDLLVDRMGWNGQRLADSAHIEFETLEAPTRKEFWRYVRLTRKARCGFARSES